MLRLVPLGGLGEIGMNCLALEQERDVILVDCGVTFPSTDLGIDVYHPRFDYALERHERLRAVVLTHGHEDHVGALPYLLDRVDVPIFGPAHALEIARHRLLDSGLRPDQLDLRATPVGVPYDVGSFRVEPIRVTHSIADATALAIETDAGTVVHTGDFKLDDEPVDGELTDEPRLETLGRSGVRLLLSDSTSIDAPGRAGSERRVGDAVARLVESAKTRVVVGMFASNVQRLVALGDVAQRTGRKMCLLGRSVQTHVKAAMAVGRLPWPSDLLVPSEALAQLPRDRVLVIASGTQAERAAALWRLATGAHPAMRLEPGDVVILSSRIIPGNDRPVFELMGHLLRAGVALTTRIDDPSVHASGHAHRDELARMIELTRPRALLPVHGTLHHLVRHAALGRSLGVGEVVVAENGDVLEVGADAPLRKIATTPTGKVATYGGEELAAEVIRERAQIARSGMCAVAIVIDAAGAPLVRPAVLLRGVAGPGDHDDVAVAVRRAVAETLRARPPRAAGDARSDDGLVEALRLATRRAIEEQVGGRPVVVVSLSRR